VAAFLHLVVMDQFGIRLLCPAPRGWIEFVREDAHGNRDGDAFGIEIPFAPIFPIETGARKRRVVAARFDVKRYYSLASWNSAGIEQQREDHWAIVDLIGKAGHMRTVPVPDWVKQITDEWVVAAGVGSGRLLRCVSRSMPWKNNCRFRGSTSR
jgi:hypothetical protein